MGQNRREFLCSLFRYSVGTLAALNGLTVCQAAPARRNRLPPTLVEVPQRWWRNSPDGKVQCFLCPFT